MTMEPAASGTLAYVRLRHGDRWIKLSLLRTSSTSFLPIHRSLRLHSNSSTKRFAHTHHAHTRLRHASRLQITLAFPRKPQPEPLVRIPCSLPLCSSHPCSRIQKPSPAKVKQSSSLKPPSVAAVKKAPTKPVLVSGTQVKHGVRLRCRRRRVVREMNGTRGGQVE